MSKLKIAFISLGCSKNLVDSQKILGTLLSGCELTNNYSEAEVIFINTCGFIEDAKKEAIATILEMADYKKQGKCKKLIVMGCLAERYTEQLKQELPEIDLVIPLNQYDRLKDIVSDFLSVSLRYNYGEKRELTNSAYSAYIKIADGCDNCCSYCAIPIIRKKYRSVKIEEIIFEAKQLLDKGVKELVLIAQDTTFYGKDIYGKVLLNKLLKEINALAGDFWVRILYMYPNLLDKELIDTMLNLPKVLMYFDLPMQHGSDKMLKLMNRKGTVRDFQNKVDYLASLNCKYVLRTTMMVGFPGETEDDFKELLQFVKKVRFHRLGAFIYCKEEDTPAFNYEPEISLKVAQKRYHMLILLQQKIAKQKNEELLHQVVEVLIEGKKDAYYQARSLYQSPDGVDGYIWVNAKEKLEIGKFYQVYITEVKPYDLYGEIV